LRDAYLSQKTPHGKAYLIARKLEELIPVELTDTDHAKSAGLYDFGDQDVAYLARTLTNRGKAPDLSAKQAGAANADDSQESPRNLQALADAEFRLLKNASENLDIVITPATLSKPDVPINLISVRQDRQEWFGLPSVVYAVPKKFNSAATRLSPKPDS